MYDKYEHDFVILPYDVLQVEREQRQDTAPEGQKRVELHLHTKSSSMDGFNDPGKIVRLAHRMGHRAVAITDHGVCQGYPEAMLATDAIHETDPNFKLIYGCEAYFVDDMIPAVYGAAQMPLSGSFVVFDTETTGLDANTERLTEIGAVFVENGKINEEKKFCTFVNPGKPIPQKVVDLTGINDAMVADAPTPEEAIRAFKEFCGDNILVAHNAHSFDMLFIRKAGEKAVGMVARLEEVKHAKEEGVEFLTLHNPIEYIADEKGRVKQVVLQKMELGEPDASGRRSPIAIPGATETIDIDMAIVSVGVSPNPIVPSSIPGLELGRKGTIAVNENMQSSIPTIYAGGDIVRGGATVILAMGDGRKAAASMHAQLSSK